METLLKIENIKLWARVGVLDQERELGQLFILDIFLWTDFEKCTLNDDIKKTVDYSKLVQIIKVRQIWCENQLSNGVYAKDLVLHIINKLGVKAGVGFAYEFAGPAINALSMEERMTI